MLWAESQHLLPDSEYEADWVMELVEADHVLKSAALQEH